MEIKGYITNLGKYNEGELIGKWIDFPISEEELKNVLKEIGINEKYEEYFITDYENNIFNFGEYTSIGEINRIVGQYKELCECQNDEVIKALIDNYNGDLDDVRNALDRLTIYHNVDDMEDVARIYIEETDFLLNVPKIISEYFNYEKFGERLECEGAWIWFGKQLNNVICVWN